MEIFMSNEAQVEEFTRLMIEHHGFQVFEDFACLIGDKEPFPSNEGIFLWVFSQKRMRIETKVEKFHTGTRIQRIDEMLKIPEKEYKKISSSIVNYLKSLKAIGFEEIGKGVNLFGKGKVANVKAGVEFFENNLDALRKFEELTINNPIVKFAEEQGYFTVKNRDNLLWDSYFGGKAKSTKSSATATKRKKVTATKVKAKTTAKTTAKKTAKTTAKIAATAKTTAAKTTAAKTTAAKTTAAKTTAAKTTAAKTTARKQSRLISTGSLADKLKQIAASQPDSSLDGDARQKAWVKHVNGLYRHLKTWLSDSAKSGHISFNVQKVTLSEDNLGSYEMDALELDLVGAHQIIFQPVEMNILGAVGRIDVYHRGYNPHKVMLLLHDEGNNKFHWELWKGFQKQAQQTFNKGALEALLSQWIES